jgi:hypothetical protein
MKEKNIVSDKLCNNIIDAVAEHGINFEQEAWNIIATYFNKDFTSYNGKQLPSKQKLISLMRKNGEINTQLTSLFEDLADVVITEFEVAEDSEKIKEEELIQSKIEGKEKLSAKRELEKTLSVEQRRALQKAFNITV